jgi:hypothetical protein
VITYKEFIAEITRLKDEASRIRNHKRMHEDPSFRRWRLELESVVRQITQAGYELPCPVESAERAYGGYDGSAFDEHKQVFGSYQQEMDDTINELSVIIDSYKKHQEPPQRKSPPQAQVSPPEKVTFAWLWHHVPFTIAGTGIGLLCAAFALGFTAGRTDWIVKLWAALIGS